VCEACCVNRLRSCDHKVPRSRARFTVVLRGSVRPFFSASSPSIELAGVRRCVGSQALKPASLYSGPSFKAAAKEGLRCQGAAPASEASRVRQSNNAFERPVRRFTSARGRRAVHFAPSARLKARQPAAQRER
jgi:hypothetical protein